MKWQIVTLQEAYDYVDHDIPHERFQVTHFVGCAILFNKDTFYPDIRVISTFMTQGEVFQIKSEKVKYVFGNELKHHCLRCGHDSNATPVIPVNSVPFLTVWNCRFQMMTSCPLRGI